MTTFNSIFHMGNTLENLSTPLYFFFLLHFFPPENNPLEAFQFLLQPELVAPKVWCTDFILASSYPIAGGISFVFHLCYILYLMDPMSSSSLVYSHVPFFFFLIFYDLFYGFQLPATVVKLGISPLNKIHITVLQSWLKIVVLGVLL